MDLNEFSIFQWRDAWIRKGKEIGYIFTYLIYSSTECHISTGLLLDLKHPQNHLGNKTRTMGAAPKLFPCTPWVPNFIKLRCG